MNPQLLDVLTREGVLINVSVRYWRATKKLNPEDLGLNRDQVTDRLISLGHKKLLPKDQLQSLALIESRAHALVESSTFPFLNGLGHFLPNAKLEEVTGKLNALEKEFQAAQKDFLDRYGELRKQATEEWREAASRLVQDPDRLVAAIEAAFPDLKCMDKHFGFQVLMFQIRVPEGLGLDMVGIADQQQIIQAREQAAKDAAVKIHHDAEQFVADCVASLRQQTAELCKEMLSSIQDGKIGVHQKTLNRLIRFIDEFKQLNFAGDREMETQLDRVRQEFLSRTAEEYRDDAVAKARLQEGLSGLAEQARNLAQQDARELVEQFGQLGRRKFSLAA